MKEVRHKRTDTFPTSMLPKRLLRSTAPRPPPTQVIGASDTQIQSLHDVHKLRGDLRVEEEKALEALRVAKVHAQRRHELQKTIR